MVTKKTTRGVPTAAEVKRLARIHTKAEDDLRRAEMKVFLSKKKPGKRPY
jgi:hypothetical protein